MKPWTSFSVLVLAAAAIFFGVGVSSIVSIRRQSSDAEWVEHSHDVLEDLETTLRFATDARRSVVGYVAAGDPRRLQNCFSAQTQTEAAAGRVAEVTRDNPLQQRRITALTKLLGEERASFNAIISARDRSAGSAVAVLQSPEWSGHFIRIQALINDMKFEETRLLALRNEMERSSVRRAQLVVAGGDIIAFGLFLAAFLVSRRERYQRHAAELRLASANLALSDRVSDLQKRSTELTLLTRLGQMLQTCETQEEAGTVVRGLLPKLFPDTRGTMFIIAASRNLVVPVASWPVRDEDPDSFPPTDCWALRSGTIHRRSFPDFNVVCKHEESEPPDAAVCVPLMAHGEALGLLHVRFAAGGEQPIDVVIATAEQLSLATANLMMQETLRRQAMRDPLTGLFNRRYMEETLQREIHRAARQEGVIGVLLLDLDHFKDYNDTLGHSAGDDLLRSFAAIMQRSVRAEDVVCRYGGDEFVIIMPDSAAAAVDRRAHDLHVQLSRIPRHDSATATSVTVSIGVALYPTDGLEGKDLLLAADRALYTAKRAGRARVARASSD